MLCTVLRNFVNDVMFSCHGARIKHDAMFRRSLTAGSISWMPRQLLQCLVEFIGMRHQGQSLLSTIDFLQLENYQPLNPAYIIVRSRA